jgi:hypothetical protein
MCTTSEELREANELILDLFSRACLREDGTYSHDFISAYESAQAWLLGHGLIKKEDCRYDDEP